MPRIQQCVAVKGSQKWLQKLVNKKTDLFNSFIRTKFNLPDIDTITWLSLLQKMIFQSARYASRR